MAREAASIAAIVQARMGSTRLPGKVLAEIDGGPALALLLDRLGRATEPDLFAVATSERPEDDAIVKLCGDLGIRALRGPQEDVLERYRRASAELECDGVIRITGDCPLIDPAVVDLVAARWRSGQEDYVANVIEPRTFPQGQDTEVLSRAALETAAVEAEDAYDREHVTPFVRARPERFPQFSVEHDPPLSGMRMVLDTGDDLARLRALVAARGSSASMDEYVDELSSSERPSR